MVVIDNINYPDDLNSEFLDFVERFDWAPLCPPFDPEVDDAVNTVKNQCEKFLVDLLDKNIKEHHSPENICLSVEKVEDQVVIAPNNFTTALIMMGVTIVWVKQNTYAGTTTLRVGDKNYIWHSDEKILEVRSV